MDSPAYVTNNVFTSRVTPNHETFLGQRALGARPYSVGWQTLQLAFCYLSCPQVSHILRDAIAILITRQEVHTHHQLADVHTHYAYSLPVHSPHGTSPQSRL